MKVRHLRETRRNVVGIWERPSDAVEEAMLMVRRPELAEPVSAVRLNALQDFGRASRFFHQLQLTRFGCELVLDEQDSCRKVKTDIIAAPALPPKRWQYWHVG
jgi:hypothetical protein